MKKIYKAVTIFGNTITMSQQRSRQIWTDIKESIAGTEQDFTSGSLKKAIFLLSVPMVLEMLMEAIFAVVDIYFVSKLGSEAVATVGLTESLITIVYAIGVGLSMATTALVSRRIGEKDPSRAARAAFQSIITGLAVSILIAIPGIFYAKELLILMGASEKMFTEMSSYTAIMLGGNAVIMLLFIINAVFRSAGDAAISFRVLIIANGLNIILDPMLIFGIGPFPELGIKGAAIATNTGRGIAVIYQLYLLFFGNGRVKLLARNIRIHFATIRKLLRLSAGGIGQYLIATSSWIGLFRIIAEFGSDALAGYTVAIRVVIFTLLPAWGISNAAATLVGQNLGAGKPERAEKSVWTVSKINMYYMGFVSIALIMIPEFFINLFDVEPTVYVSGVSSLRILSYGFILYGLGMVVVQSFNGAGDTMTPTWINLICFWALEIPLAYLMALELNIGEQGVYYAVIISESLMAIIAVWFFKKGKWKLKQV
jgi:putative MATE family efflux protein